jgi:protein-L-isoaspartate O-methyltransferase
MGAVEDRVAGVAALFDGLAARYDQSGVDFFTLIARGLVDRLEPRAGESVLDIGAGRGAATLPLADAVGADGRVDTVDVAPAMVRLLTEDTVHLPQVHVSQGDATAPEPPAPPYDAIASSMVVFFLPDPVDALTRWRGLLRDGGRLGVATVRPWRDGWQALHELEEQFAGDRPAQPADDEPGPWDSDAGVEDILVRAGFSDVRTEIATHGIRFASYAEWQEWAMGTLIRGIWLDTPESLHPEIERRVTEILEQWRDDSGLIVLEIDARYTFGRA